MNRLDTLQDKVCQANKEMRMYRLKVAGTVLGALLVGVLSLAAALGANSEVSNSDDNDNNNEV